MAHKILTITKSKAMEKAIALAFEKSEPTLYFSESLAGGIKEAPSAQVWILDAADISKDKEAIQKDLGKVVVLLGSGDNLLKEELQSLGVKSFLKKPFEQSDLLSTIEQFIPDLQEEDTGETPRKGRRAFAGQDLGQPLAPPQIENFEKASSELKQSISSEILSEVSSAPVLTLDPDGKKKFEQIVEEYCRENFPRVAKKVIEAQLRKLAAEKNKHMLEG